MTVRCGHVEKFGLLPDGKDRFREDRRKKATGRDCKACREKRQREEQEAAERRRAEKERQKAAGRRTTAATREGAAGRPAARRPRFEVQYDAAKEQWSGTLTVPTAAGEAAFAGSRSALFKLFARLDEQYRATLG